MRVKKLNPNEKKKKRRSINILTGTCKGKHVTYYDNT